LATYASNLIKLYNYRAQDRRDGKMRRRRWLWRTAARKMPHHIMAMVMVSGSAVSIKLASTLMLRCPRAQGKTVDIHCIW